jgi:hypothetical protein
VYELKKSLFSYLCELTGTHLYLTAHCHESKLGCHNYTAGLRVLVAIGKGKKQKQKNKLEGF